MVKFTSKDVARVAGVAQSTVSYVLTGKRSISEATRRRVQEAIDQLTYQPNAGARALASQRTSVIGLVVPFSPGVDTVGRLPFIETITSLAREHDHDILLITADEGSDGLRRLAGRSLCDAIVIMDVQVEDERVPLAASLSVPVVLIGVPRDSSGLHCVDVDFEGAADSAVKEMVATGHDRVLVIGHPVEEMLRDLNYIPRFNNSAFRALERHNLAPELISPVEPGRASAEAVVARILSDNRAERLGLIIPYSRVIQPILNALNARAVVPGRDISVIANCTNDVAEESEPPVTNVSLEPREVSRRAIETVFKLLDHTQPEPEAVIDLVPSRLTRRDTVMPPPAAGVPPGTQDSRM
jgi:DNA-binding LacI/PurR family transcriptional regulator